MPHSATRILLVEDEPTIAVTLGDDLQDHGYEVTQVADGAAAIRLLGEQEFDAVITDLRLPGATGVQVLQAAKRARPWTAVLVITAHAGELLADLQRHGAGAVLDKPFANGVVIDWLRTAC